MNDKSTVLKAFNNHFIDFIQDVSNIFPENDDIKSTKTALEFLKKANPSSIVKAWHYFVYVQYKDVIQSGDITFFFDKDYKDDLNHMKNSNEIMKAIDKIREPVKQMSNENKAHTMKYIQNLCRLSDVYMTLG